MGSRVSSRTYRKITKKQQPWLRLRLPQGQFPKSISSSETVSSRPNSTSSSSESSPRMDTPVSSSENLRPAKLSSSPLDQARFSVRRPDESVNSPLSTSDGATSRARSTSASNELPTEASPPSPRPSLFDTNSSEASPSDEPPTVSSDS